MQMKNKNIKNKRMYSLKFHQSTDIIFQLCGPVKTMSLPPSPIKN